MKPLSDLTESDIVSLDLPDLRAYITDAQRRVLTGAELSPHETANMVHITVLTRRKAVTGNPRASKAAKENAVKPPDFDAFAPDPKPNGK